MPVGNCTPRDQKKVWDSPGDEIAGISELLNLGAGNLGSVKEQWLLYHRAVSLAPVNTLSNQTLLIRYIFFYLFKHDLILYLAVLQ